MKENYRLMRHENSYLVEKEESPGVWGIIDEVETIELAKKKLEILRGEDDGE